MKLTLASVNCSQIRLVDRFQETFEKVLSGEYKSLYPVEFYNALTQVHAIFGDRKQVQRFFSHSFLSFC